MTSQGSGLRTLWQFLQPDISFRFPLSYQMAISQPSKNSDGNRYLNPKGCDHPRGDPGELASHAPDILKALGLCPPS